LGVAGLRAASRRRAKKRATLETPAVAASNGHPPFAAAPPITASNGRDPRCGDGPSHGGTGQLVARLEDPHARWMLSVVADGALSGLGASAHYLHARAGGALYQRDLDRWSHRITVLCDQLGTATPFRQLDVAPFGTVYQMEPGVAQQIKAALNGDDQHLRSTMAIQ